MKKNTEMTKHMEDIWERAHNQEIRRMRQSKERLAAKIKSKKQELSI